MPSKSRTSGLLSLSMSVPNVASAPTKTPVTAGSFCVDGVSGVVELPDKLLVLLPHPEPKANIVSSITEMTAKNSLRLIFTSSLCVKMWDIKC